MVLLASLNWCSYLHTLVWTMVRENGFVEVQQLCSAQRHARNHSNLRTFLTPQLCLYHLGAVCQVPQKLSPFVLLAFFVHIFLRQHLVCWGHGLSWGFVGGSLYNINIVKATNKAFCFLPSPFPVSSATGITALVCMFIQHLLHLGIVIGKKSRQGRYFSHGTPRRVSFVMSWNN